MSCPILSLYTYGDKVYTYGDKTYTYGDKRKKFDCYNNEKRALVLNKYI